MLLQYDFDKIFHIWRYAYLTSARNIVAGGSRWNRQVVEFLDQRATQERSWFWNSKSPPDWRLASVRFLMEEYENLKYTVSEWKIND